MLPPIEILDIILFLCNAKNILRYNLNETFISYLNSSSSSNNNNNNNNNNNSNSDNDNNNNSSNNSSNSNSNSNSSSNMILVCKEILKSSWKSIETLIGQSMNTWMSCILLYIEKLFSSMQSKGSYGLGLGLGLGIVQYSSLFPVIS